MQVGGASAIEVESVRDFPASWGLDDERLAETSEAAWGSDADPPSISAIVEEDGTHGDFALIEAGDGVVVLDEQGASLEEFPGVGYGANSCAS